MKKENVKIKENITIADQIAVIDYIMNYYFTDSEYTPYYSGMARVEAIARYFLEGITFEKEDIIYDCVVEDKEIYDLVKKFYFDESESKAAENRNKKNAKYLNIMAFVIENVNEKLEFEKQKVIHCTVEKSDLLSSIDMFLSDLDKVMKNFANLELSKLTPEVIDSCMKVMNQLKDKEITPEVLSNVIKDAVDFKVPETEIYEGQRKQIGNLKKLLNDERKKNSELEKENRPLSTRSLA